LVVQRSDSVNLVLLAKSLSAQGRNAESLAVLAEVVQAWPTIIFSRGWEGVLPPSVTTGQVVEAALARWHSGAPMPETRLDQGIWLTALSGVSNAVSAEVATSPLGPALADALAMTIRCEPIEATLDAMDPAQQRSHLYWWLRVRSEILNGSSPSGAVEMASLMGNGLLSRAASRMINPLDENSAFSTDGIGYRRRPISWPRTGATLPSELGGTMRWIFRPQEAIASAGMATQLPLCAESSP
jgi:hypothetical protein